MNTELLASRIAARYRSAKGMEPATIRSAKSMYEELVEAEQRMHKAAQFARGLAHEPHLEWVVEQLNTQHKELEQFVKNAKDALEYVLRQDI